MAATTSAPGRPGASGATLRAPQRRIAWVAVVAGLAVLGGLMLWGQWAGTGRSLVGSEVAYDGGRFMVTGAYTTDDPMMLMHPDNADQFAALGMQMGSSMISDAIPEGSKRVVIELSLGAGSSEMSFPASDTRLSAEGVDYGPYLALLGDESLLPGARINGVVLFEVPIETGAAEFRLGPDARPVHVDVSGSSGGPGHDADH